MRPLSFPLARVRPIGAALVGALFLTAPARADAPPLDLTPGLETALKPNCDQVKIEPSADPAHPGTVFTIQPGPNGYPGASLTPAKPWDLSSYGHIEATVTNLGDKQIGFSLRVDNAGDWKDQPWNAESVWLKPGQSGTVSTIFGYSYGHNRGYKLNPAAVSNLVLFVMKSDAVQSFRLETLQAAGPAGEKPAVPPDQIRVKPEKGVIFGGVAFDPAKQLSARNATAEFVTGKPQAIKVTFPAGQNDQSVSLKPPIGRWNLTDDLQVKIKVHNIGEGLVAPRARVNSNGGATSWVTGPALAAGATGEIVVPFIEATPANIDVKDSGNKITSNNVSSVDIALDKADAPRSLAIESVIADLPPLNQPSWLGKRPPVDGDWVQTLNENFDGKSLNTDIWNTAGPNYYDKQSHWSKDNVLVGDGVARMRYERKIGNQNDDPKGQRTNYQSGYLDTYGKWTQRYGYFESRMKIPNAPGLWPAFWMMPDRGAAYAPEQWKRQATEPTGMEFDIMENLTRYGTARWGAGCHWDGYDKNHKSNGNVKIYARPDKDGYITAGLLWTPGLAVFYANGQEVLRWENPRVSDVTSDLMFTLPQGGWDNDPIDDDQLPADFIVDYVRCWQRKDLASPADFGPGHQK